MSKKNDRRMDGRNRDRMNRDRMNRDRMNRDRRDWDRRSQDRRDPDRRSQDKGRQDRKYSDRRYQEVRNSRKPTRIDSVERKKLRKKTPQENCDFGGGDCHIITVVCCRICAFQVGEIRFQGVERREAGSLSGYRSVYEYSSVRSRFKK